MQTECYGQFSRLLAKSAQPLFRDCKASLIDMAQAAMPSLQQGTSATPSQDVCYGLHYEEWFEITAPLI